MSTLTVLINTKNEEKNIKVCLNSVKAIADEILVVDMNSSDGTVALAEKSGAKVIHYKTDHGFADPARNFALTKVKTDWVFILDADELIESSVAANIKKLIEDPGFDVYYLPRKNIIFDKWIQHTGWWPDYQPRLFREGFLDWPGVVHAQPVVKGNIKHLPTKSEFAITHQNYNSISHFFDKLNRYTTLSAEKTPTKNRKSPVSSAQALNKFFSEFLRRYFAQDGIKDGVHGAGLSIFQATYELTTYLKKWELGGYPTTNFDSDSGIRELRSVQKELNYWIADYKVRHLGGLQKLWWRIRRKYQI
ncbi:MAG: glycosyltransferase family 2 protein [Candidatus Pacebacteria bacterium]|nr:glycosyltransferase family 2 protein [Candidatus Paceibacterota bacterium]